MDFNNSPIKNEPNERIDRGDSKKRRTEPREDKFQSEMDSTKSAPKLKKHSKSLDSETDEELGKLPEEENSKISLFDLSADTKEKKKQPSVAFDNQKELAGQGGDKQPQSAPMPHEGSLLAAIAGNAVQKAPSTSAEELQQIVQKIIDSIQQMELKGKVDTIVTLTHPPMLKGANVVLTSFNSAKGEFNIAFENLSQPAKVFLDGAGHLDTLKAGLEQKGYVTHIISTSTTEETRPFTTAQTYSREDERQQQQEQEEQEQDEQES